MMLRRVPSCCDIERNAREVLAGTLRSQEHDSTALVLDYWIQRCGNSGISDVVSVLLAIERGDFSDSSYSADLVDHLADLRRRRAAGDLPVHRGGCYWIFGYGEEPVGDDLDEQIYAWSGRLRERRPPDPLAQDLVEFMGPDPESLFPKLQQGAHTGTMLAHNYAAEVASAKELSETHYGVILGAWMPIGPLAVLGSHPELGLRYGVKMRRWNFAALGAFRFGSSAEPYEAQRNSGAVGTERTSHFFGYHFGGEVGRDLVPPKANELQLLSGIGYDAFTALKENEEDDLGAAVAISLDLNVGLEYRHYVNERWYVGLQSKYHWVDFTLSDAVEMTGQPFTLSLLFGMVSNVSKQYRYDMLQLDNERIRPKRVPQ